jgi:hypothetical protein
MMCGIGPEATSALSSVNVDQFPQLHRKAWIDLFLKYNAPLPSSSFFMLKVIV